MAQTNYTCEGCGKEFGTLVELQDHTESCPEVRRLESSGRPRTKTAGSINREE